MDVGSAATSRLNGAVHSHLSPAALLDSRHLTPQHVQVPSLLKVRSPLRSDDELEDDDEDIDLQEEASEDEDDDEDEDDEDQHKQAEPQTQPALRFSVDLKSLMQDGIAYVSYKTLRRRMVSKPVNLRRTPVECVGEGSGSGRGDRSGDVDMGGSGAGSEADSADESSQSDSVIDYYDVNDPFIDDSGLLSRAAAETEEGGFFVHGGDASLALKLPKVKPSKKKTRRRNRTSREVPPEVALAIAKLGQRAASLGFNDKKPRSIPSTLDAALANFEVVNRQVKVHASRVAALRALGQVLPWSEVTLRKRLSKLALDSDVQLLKEKLEAALRHLTVAIEQDEQDYRVKSQRGIVGGNVVKNKDKDKTKSGTEEIDKSKVQGDASGACFKYRLRWELFQVDILQATKHVASIWKIRGGHNSKTQQDFDKEARTARSHLLSRIAGLWKEVEVTRSMVANCVKRYTDTAGVSQKKSSKAVTKSLKSQSLVDPELTTPPKLSQPPSPSPHSFDKLSSNEKASKKAKKQKRCSKGSKSRDKRKKKRIGA